MNPILTICPSRERAEKLKRMIESFYYTSTFSDLAVIIDKNEPQLDAYWEIVRVFPEVILWETDLQTNAERYNAALKEDNRYKYYHLTNDDVVYQTKDWDQKFMHILKARPGVIYGNDLKFGEQLCTFPMVNGDIARGLGWLHLPSSKYLFNDNAWMIIGRLMNSLTYCEGVIIEHKHPIAGKAAEDCTFKRTNSKEVYDHDNMAFLDWCAKDALKDVKRISQYLQKLKD